ncbi:PREDICTED: tetratricopeptide repeat protein 5-like [Nicotiana attenuata]|uniref:tetratricopeptide repeat protein 5-like n=1 Tax=Nicotiana attenuata TaxID=49451 RepID=UPI0009059AA6|nr:PREDICTED: tetratricopeptide repeat protein 5-like [Nicotiana attenuata]
MLLQSLKGYKNAKKDERMRISSHMCYNCVMTYKYFEDYETALAGFEAAELMDPGHNALEQAFNLYEILEGINSFLQDLNGAKLHGSPTSSLPAVESLASSLASVDLNPTYEKATLDRLTEGPNLRKAVTGKVLFSLKNLSENPIYYVVCDSDRTCFVITVYGVCSTAIKEEDQATLLDPFYHIFDFKSERKGNLQLFESLFLVQPLLLWFFFTSIHLKYFL